MSKKFTDDFEIAFEKLYTQGAFLTAGNSNKANTMTISWGSVGYMWRKPMFMALVRESRYTNEFLDLGKSYTISIPYKDNMKAAISICGGKSGRDIDKEKEANIKFLPAKSVESPIIADCDRYYECRIVFKQEMDINNIDENIKKAFYPENETKHVLYFGEIVEQY